MITNKPDPLWAFFHYYHAADVVSMSAVTAAVIVIVDVVHLRGHYRPYFVC